MQKQIISLILCTFATACVYGQGLTPDSKKDMLSKIESDVAALLGADDSTLKKVIAELEVAVTDPKKSMEFLKAVTDKAAEAEGKRVTSYPEEWKERGYDKAVQIQMQWALITLKAGLMANKAKLAGDEFDSSAYSTPLLNMLATLVAEVKNEKGVLKDQQIVLMANPIGGAFSKVYNIGNVRPPKWSAAPLDITGVFESVVLPPLRTKKDYSALRAAWNKRIELETQLAQTVGEELESTKERDRMMGVVRGVFGVMGGNKPGGLQRSFASASGNSRQAMAGMANSMPTTAATALKSKQDPKELTDQEKARIRELVWQREVDCFNAGDEELSAKNLYAMIAKEEDMKRKMSLLKSLKNLVSGEKEATPEDSNDRRRGGPPMSGQAMPR